MKHNCKCYHQPKEPPCKHKHVEYCEHCEKVHCKVCGKEWPEEEQTYIPHYYYPYYITLPEPYKPAWEITWGGNTAIPYGDTTTIAEVQYTLT